MKTAEIMNNPFTHLRIFDREKIYLWYSQKISSVNFPFKTAITFRAGQLRFVTILFLSDLGAKIAALLLEMQENTADFVKLGELQAEIDLFNDEKDEIEMTLLEAMEELENL